MKKQLAPANKSIDEIKDTVRNNSVTTFDPYVVLRNAEKELAKSSGKSVALTSHNDLFKAVTLFEFDNGMLMTTEIYISSIFLNFLTSYTSVARPINI